MDIPQQKTIRIGRASVGLIGLDVAINRALADRLPEEEAVEFLFEAVRRQNYIPPAAGHIYREALRREYCRSRDQTTGGHQVLTVRILGPGCVSCNRLHKTLIDILDELGLAADVENIHDLDEIWRHGVMMTPALVINGETKSAGRLPTTAQIKEWLQTAAAQSSG